MKDMNETAKRSAWKLFGLCGAILAPAVIAILTFSPIPRDSASFQIIRNVVFYSAWPFRMFIFKGLPAIGIEYTSSLAYLVPIFMAFFLYWAFIGFIIGVLVAGIRQMINKAQQSGPAYPPQGVGSADP